MNFCKRGFRAMVLGLLVAAGLALAPAAFARGHVSIGINLPGVSVGYWGGHHSHGYVGAGGYYGGYYAPTYYAPAYYDDYYYADDYYNAPYPAYGVVYSSGGYYPHHHYRGGHYYNRDHGYYYHGYHH